MRAASFAKAFFCCSLAAIFFFVYMSIKDFSARPYSGELIKVNQNVLDFGLRTLDDSDSFNDNKNNTHDKPVMKYILQWTSPKTSPFVYMGVGQEGFKRRNCPYTNCFVTSNRSYLGDITNFDVIAFAGPEIVRIPNRNLPQKRSPKQKYVFATIESSQYYPLCSKRLDGFFNWTWTFRLDSEVRWGYILIKDWNNNTIGPNKIMHWKKLEEMDPVSVEFKEKLKTKNKAAAWFVSNCYDKSGRLKFALELQLELEKYELGLDIYGECGTLTCPRGKHEKECNKMLDNTYYFYLSFENSFSEDYVTEKLLKPLLNNAVPIVFGGANYTRFMLDGIYLNAREMGVQKLAAKMNELINNPDQYADFFRWHKYYSYHSRHESPETNEYCRFCITLNDEVMVRNTTVMENFKDWWDSPPMCFE